MRGRFVVSAVCICVFAFVCSAKRGSAQSGPKEPSAATPAAPKSAESDTGGSPEYRELIEQALVEFRHKNWPEARVLFRRAHDLSPSARTLRGMGVVSYEMRDYVQAVLQLSAALVDTRQPLNEGQRKEASALLARARTFIGSYTLLLEPSDAEVMLDGAQLVRDVEGRVLVAFGEHTLEASAPGHQRNVSKIAVQGGEHGELRIVLYRDTGDPQSGATSLGRVEKSVEQPPATTIEDSTRRAPERGFNGRGLRYTWVALGASAAFGAAAAGVWFGGKGKVDELVESCDDSEARGIPCQRGSVDTSGVQRFERTTNALIGLSAASLATAVVLAAFEWPRERKLALDVGPRQLSLRGSF